VVSQSAATRNRRNARPMHVVLANIRCDASAAAEVCELFSSYRPCQLVQDDRRFGGHPCPRYQDLIYITKLENYMKTIFHQV
jgi:hypothetical protein